MSSEKRKKSINPSIIAVLVLVVIALISGALLSVLNNVLYVSDEERTNRDLSKVYQSESFTELQIDDEYSKYRCIIDGKEVEGEVIYVYQAADGAIIIKTKGPIGYKGRSEIVMAVKDGVIVNMIVSSFGGDDKTTTIKDKYLKQYTGKTVDENLKFVMGGASAEGDVDVSGGASSKFTMNSICVAANTAVYYLNNTDVMGGAAQ